MATRKPRGARDWQRVDDAATRALEQGLSAREGLKRYRARAKAAGGRGIRDATWFDRFELARLRAEGVDTSRLPPRRGAGTYTTPRSPMKVTRDPGRSRWFYWLRLVIAEPDSTRRDDQHYSFDHQRHLTDRQAVMVGIDKWNQLVRKSPRTGSLTGVAVGGWVVAVAPIEKGDSVR